MVKKADRDTNLLSSSSNDSFQLRSQPLDQGRLGSRHRQASLLELDLEVSHLHVIQLVEQGGGVVDVLGGQHHPAGGRGPGGGRPAGEGF